MKWIYIKIFCILMLFYAAVDLFRSYTGLSITAGDIIIILISFLSLYGAYFILSNHQYNRRKNQAITQSFWQLIGILLLTIALSPLFIWLSALGWLEAFTVFESVRSGRAHGYSLIFIGGAMAICSMGFSLMTIDKLIRLLKNT